MSDPNFQGAQNVWIARPGQRFWGLLSTERTENLAQPTQPKSLMEVSCASCSWWKDCIGVVERAPGRSCLGMCYSTTAERNPRPWAEEWSLKAVRWSTTAGREPVGIATHCSAYIVSRRHQS